MTTRPLDEIKRGLQAWEQARTDGERVRIVREMSEAGRRLVQDCPPPRGKEPTRR